MGVDMLAPLILQRRRPDRWHRRGARTCNEAVFPDTDNVPMGPRYRRHLSIHRFRLDTVEGMQPRSIVPAILVAVVGMALAAWVSIGRLFFGVAGELTQVYTFTLGLVIVVLHLFVAEALARTAHN